MFALTFHTFLFIFFYHRIQIHNLFFFVTYDLTLSHVIGRAQQHPRGGMAGGIRGNFGSRADGAVQLDPRSSTPIPDRHNYIRPGHTFGVKLDEYIKMAADAQAEPGLPQGFSISDDEYVPLPAGHVSYKTDAEGIEKMFEAKRARKHGLPPPPGSPPKLIGIDANGVSKRLSTIRPGATTHVSQACSSTSTQLHRAAAQADTGRIGYVCVPKEYEEIEIKEEVQ